MAKNTTIKTSKHEAIQRTNQVQKWIVEGKSRPFIIQEFKNKWGGCDNTVDKYIRKAREAWVEEFNAIDRKEMVSEIAAKFIHLYGKALDQKQLAVSHASLTAMMKLMALDRVH